MKRCVDCARPVPSNGHSRRPDRCPTCRHAHERELTRARQKAHYERVGKRNANRDYAREQAARRARKAEARRIENAAYAAAALRAYRLRLGMDERGTAR